MAQTVISKSTAKTRDAYHACERELLSLFARPGVDPMKYGLLEEPMDWYGLKQQLTDADLDAIEVRAQTATPGPWHWTERVVNTYLKACYPRRSRERYIYLLQGRPKGSYMDHWDSNVLRLMWRELKRDFFMGLPDEKDREFIAHARTDVVRLLSEVRALRAQLRGSEQEQGE